MGVFVFVGVWGEQRTLSSVGVFERVFQEGRGAIFPFPFPFVTVRITRANVACVHEVRATSHWRQLVPTHAEKAKWSNASCGCAKRQRGRAMADRMRLNTHGVHDKKLHISGHL